MTTPMFTQSDIDMAVFLETARRRRFHNQLIIPQSERQRQAYDAETTQLTVFIRGQQAAHTNERQAS